MKHLLKFNESNSYIDLIDIIEDRFILHIADEYQLKEYTFDIFRKGGSYCVYKEDGDLAEHTRGFESWTAYHDGYRISRNDDFINIQLFFEMKSKKESVWSDEDKTLFKKDYPDVYESLKNFINRVYEITKNLKMKLDWRSSKEEPQIYTESCYDFRAYNISLYFTIDKEYKYESDEEKYAKTMKWARDIIGHEEFDRLTKRNENINGIEYYKEVSSSDREQFKSNHILVESNKHTIDRIKKIFGEKSRMGRNPR